MYNSISKQMENQQCSANWPVHAVLMSLLDSSIYKQLDNEQWSGNSVHKRVQ